MCDYYSGFFCSYRVSRGTFFEVSTSNMLCFYHLIRKPGSMSTIADACSELLLFYRNESSGGLDLVLAIRTFTVCCLALLLFFV